MRKTLFFFGSLLFWLLIAEGVLRLFWILPYHPIPYKLECQEGNPYVPDSILGFGLQPGTFDITINDWLNYHATHTSFGERVPGVSRDTLEHWGIFGCSFSYGMGVSDNRTFAALLQQDLPCYYLSNYSGPAYSQVHALLKLRTLAEEGNFPDRVLLPYLHFHDRQKCAHFTTTTRLCHCF